MTRTRTNPRGRREEVSTAAVFAWAGGIGVLMSTQFLAQPFVWRNWPVSEVAEGWLRVATDRLLVALAIAVFVALAVRAPATGLRRRLAILAAAVVAGAMVGDLLDVAVDPLAARPAPWNVAGRIIHWSLISAMGVGILGCWRLQAENAAEVADARGADARARHLLVVADLDALQRQIEPHFLFNTLATVRRFGQTSPLDGQSLMDRLFDYVSNIFEASQSRVSTLGAELDLIMAYLDVCAVRMGPRLRIVCDIPSALRAYDFPPLMLGTLVENAVRHGIAPLPAGGVIALTAREAGEWLEVCVTDNGIGLTDDGGTGIGLVNLTERLRLIYGDYASLRLETREPHGVSAALRLPRSRAADVSAH